MAGTWTKDSVLETARAFEPACVLAAAAEIDLFTPLGVQPMTARSLADRLGTDVRGTTILLDALAATDLLTKTGQTYSISADVAPLLTSDAPDSILPMLQHRANCLRRWAQLARVVQSGRPAESAPSIRGPQGDQAAFIGAMHVINEPEATRLVAELGPPPFRHLLDVGGASGTWTIAFLRAVPGARATLFDLPDVIPQARERLSAAGLADRVTLMPGDFYTDPLPAGADLAWLSAIAHQNSRAQNRELFGKIHRALTPDGTLLIRDVVMAESRIRPVPGAMFAVNMLVATQGGGTYTLGEFDEDLRAAGFTGTTLLRPDPFMHSIIRACSASAS